MTVDPDSHSFSLLDPDLDPEEKNLREKTEKCKEIVSNCNFILNFFYSKLTH